MAKKSNPTDKAARLLDLVPFIYSHQGIPLKELADVFEVSESEIVSDLNTLWMCGESRFDLVDLEFESGFVTIRNAEALNLVRSLSTQETMTLLFGLDMLREDVGPEREDLLSEIQTLRKLLSAQISELVSATPAVNSQTLTELVAAMSKRSSLNITYNSVSDDTLSERTVEPLEIFSREGKTYLLAFCHIARARRTFRVDRIIKVVQCDPPVHEGSVDAVINEQFKVEVKVHSNLRHVYETFVDVKPKSGETFEISVFNKDWLFREVLAAAGAIELVGPESIRREFSALVHQIGVTFR
jgi:predicted DNA-binding transcriptional regulator YafY